MVDYLVGEDGQFRHRISVWTYIHTPIC
jgi:hypothetical protein